METQGTIFDIKEFCLHDGPGIRTTVFFKGCPLRCIWCHNPEGLSAGPELMISESLCTGCGRCKEPCSHPECAPFGRCVHACPNGLIRLAGERLTPAQLAGRILKGRDILESGNGGVTFSGGEPLMQPQFLFETVRQLSGLHTAVETSGFADAATFEQLLETVDFVIMDVKLFDADAHQKFTGVSNERILNNLDRLKASGKDCLIRTPLIPGITDTKENLSAIEKRISGLDWEQIPFNEMAGLKYPMVGKRYLYHKEDYQ